jgi:hypothetical protein
VRFLRALSVAILFVGAIVIAGIAVREGFNAWRGDVCCAVPHAESHAESLAVPRVGGNADAAASHATSGQDADACCPGCASAQPQSLGLTIRSKN